MKSLITSIAFPCPPSSYDQDLPLLDFVTRHELSFCYQTSYQIPIRYYQLGKDYPTLLMCHGNAEDIGQTEPTILATQLNANICLFDYAGYGLHSCQRPSEKACQEDVVAVYDYLVNIKKVSPDTIVIYGRSLGTGIACYLAHYLCHSQLTQNSRLILVSPLMSAAGVVTNLWVPGDIFKNYQLAPKITFPTLILHGTQDKVVPYSCGHNLSKLFPNLYQMVVLDGCGHQDILVPTYYNNIKKFLKNTQTD